MRLRASDQTLWRQTREFRLGPLCILLCLHVAASGHFPHSGVRLRHTSAARSNKAQLTQTAWRDETTSLASFWMYGSYRMSTNRRGPKWRSRTRATPASRSGSLWRCAKSRTALATYWPTPGNASISALENGKRPRRPAISAASFRKLTARRFQRPIGRKCPRSSLSEARASACQDGNRLKNRA